MAPNKEYVTKEDLKSMETNLELKLTNQETERRHSMVNKLNNYYFTVDELEKANIKLTMTMENLNNDVSEIKSMMKEMKLSIENLPGKFVSKDEHSDNKARIKTLEDKLEKEQEKLQGLNTKIASWTAIFGVLAFFAQQFLSKTIHF